MSYGKDDFFHWDDDIDLDSLLGDYTCSEIELTDDDEPSTKKKQKAKKIVLRLKRTIVPSVLIRMRRYLGYAVIYEKNMELQMQKVRRPFNILILYISLFDFFSLDFPKNDFLSGVFLQCFHNV